MEEKFSFSSEADDIVLFHGIEFQEHFVVIIATVHDEGGFAEEGASGFYSAEGDIINGSKGFFFGRMDF